MNPNFSGDPSAALDKCLRELKEACGPEATKHDIAMAMTTVCIAEGWNTRRHIVDALRRQGLNYRHVNIILNQNTGDDPKRFHWWCDEQGRYSLHADGLTG